MKSAAVRFKSTGMILFWLLLWQVASVALHNNIILVGPLEVIHSLLFQVLTVEFWKTIAFSFGKISLGFFLAFMTGIITGSVPFSFAGGLFTTSNLIFKVCTSRFFYYFGTDLDWIRESILIYIFFSCISHDLPPYHGRLKKR